MPKFIILLLVFLFPSLAYAASFDCARAATKMEKLICGNSQLSKGDEDLAVAYTNALKEASDPAAIKKQQREWLTNAQRCDDYACLMNAFWSQIAQLANPENGIWTGTIGNQEVMACFFHFENPNYENKSGYFYLRHSQLIPLAPRPENTKIWYEDNSQTPTGLWTINERHGDLLQGNWSDATGSHILPIRLKRFKTLSMGDPTSSIIGCNPEVVKLVNAAINTRVQKEKISFDKALTFDGKRYRIFGATEEVNTLELIDKSEASTALNERLKNELAVGISEYYGCNTPSDEKEMHNYSASIELAFWNARWITFVRRTGGDCGGNHPFSEFYYTTWDLTTGKEVNLWTWVEQENGKLISHLDTFYGNYSAPDQLNKIITEEAVKPLGGDPENECLNIIKENAKYQLSLGKKGLVFHSSFAHVVQACDYDVEIPYKTLLPFLTKEGKEEVKLMMSDTSSQEAR